MNSSTLDIDCVSDQTVISNNNGCSYIVNGSEFDVQNVTSCGTNFTYEYRINSQQPIQSNTLDGGRAIRWGFEIEVFDGVNQTITFSISVP